MSRYKFSHFLYVFAVFLLFNLAFTSVCHAVPSATELNRQAKIAIKTGRYSEAFTMLKKAMKLKPSWGEPYFNASQLLRLTNKRKSMLRALKKAWELEPEIDTYHP